jgi:hypothetical protein
MGKEFFKRYGFEPSEDFKRAAATLQWIEERLGITGQAPEKKDRKTPALRVITGGKE